MNRPRLLIALLAALASALLAAGCGGGDDEDPAEVLDAALAPGGESVQSGVLSLDLDISAGGESAGSFKLAMEGPYQSGGEGALPQFDLEGSLDFEGAGQSVSADAGLVSTGEKGFVTYQGAAYELPRDVIARVAPVFQSARDQTTTASSEACTAALEERGVSRSGTLFGDLSNEGEADVEGAETTHVTGTFALANLGELVEAGVDVPACVGDLGAEVNAEQIGQFTDQLAQLDTAFQDVELGFYVGVDDDLVHGLDVDLGLAQPGGEPAEVSLQIRFGELNEPQTVTAPEDAKPASELISSLGLTPELIQQALQQGLGSIGAAGGSAPELPRAGGSTAPPTGGASQAYLECLQSANDEAALEECSALLEP